MAVEGTPRGGMPPGTMPEGIAARSWGSTMVRGLLAILFGILLFARPGITVLGLALIFGAYALVDGISALVSGVRGHWWGMIFIGVIGIVAAFIAFTRPAITLLALLYIIAAWAIVRGALDVAAAVQLRKQVSGEWLLLLAGAASVVFGILVLMYPAAGLVWMLWLIGIYAITFGVIQFFLSFRLRSMSKHAHSGSM
jgi:uncharacterized membrane protein HdeD (DUF308 family)